MGAKIHLSAVEVVVSEVHVVPLFDQLHHLAEFVHVQLPDEGGQVFVPEEVRQHLVL